MRNQDEQASRLFLRNPHFRSNPTGPASFKMTVLMMNAPFQNQKNIKELDRLLSEGEGERRQRWDARGKTLDWLLIALVIALVLTAFTRAAVWLAKAF
jgi:hypothetical protein